MNDPLAVSKADEFIRLILQHQPDLFGAYHPLTAEDKAKRVAQSLAALRAELIAQLKQQP